MIKENVVIGQKSLRICAFRRVEIPYFLRFLFVAACLALAGCFTIPLESVYVPTKTSDWKFASGSDRPGRTVAEFIPPNEVISNWSRILTIQFFEGDRESPAQVMGNLHRILQSTCPDVKWDVLSGSDTSITYRWSVVKCSGQDDQIEIARLLRGNDGIHRIAYARKGTHLAPGEGEDWVEVFSKAYVLKGGKQISLP